MRSARQSSCARAKLDRLVSNHVVFGDLFESGNFEFTSNANCFAPVNSQGLGVLVNRSNQHVEEGIGAFGNRRTLQDRGP